MRGAGHSCVLGAAWEGAELFLGCMKCMGHLWVGVSCVGGAGHLWGGIRCMGVLGTHGGLGAA